MITVAYLLITLLIINISVIVHELGHLQSARKHGIEVTEFSIGAGKVLKQWTTKKGLLVSWKLLPTGGSVSPVGMTVEEAEEKGHDRNKTYIYASPLTRMRVTGAGIGYNMLLALVFEAILISYYTEPSTLQDFMNIPMVMFWSTFALLGIFISILFVAPFNGFENIGSIITIPGGVSDTMTHANEEGIPLIIAFMLIMMVINMFMAVLNCLPIYPLDGFFIATAVADMARKSIHSKDYVPLTMKKLNVLVLGGYSAAVSIMGYLIIRDLFRLFT